MNRETMTPTDRFACAAMNNIANIAITYENYHNTDYNEIARKSYEIADEMMKEKYKRDTHLCRDCRKSFATCNGNMIFGLGLGNDNIIKCDIYRKKDKHKIRTFFRRMYFKIKNIIK